MIKQSFTISEETLPIVSPMMAQAIIDAIPSGWGVASGTFRVTGTLAVNAEIASGTRLRFGYSKLDVTNIGTQSDIRGLFFQNKLPEEVLFGESANPCKVITLEEVKWIIKYLINTGYAGHLFISHKDSGDEGTVRYLEIHMPPDQSRLKIELGWEEWWQSQYATEWAEMIQPILKILEALKLTKE